MTVSSEHGPIQLCSMEPQSSSARARQVRSPVREVVPLVQLYSDVKPNRQPCSGRAVQFKRESIREEVS